ncbi:MAG: FeoA family protein [Candidatus Nezhaarchaeota archaeon]|nr:FeoA family protein [Candidatus Nezhaarchaeota archaeon]
MSVSKDVLSCLLEALMAFKQRGLFPNESLLAKELNEPPSKVRQLLDEAVKLGLAVSRGDYYEVTDEGVKRILKHRELYIHDVFVHGSEKWSRNVADWGRHWRRKHGLTKRDLEAFYGALANLNERIENLKPLVELKPGERGIIVSTVCGSSAMRRLAEMGVTPGTLIEVVGRAPLRGPVEIDVRGTRLVLGYGLASRIAVQKLQ